MGGVTGRHTSFSFTLRPTAAQEQVLWRHAGASRFAYNQSLALVNDAVAAKKAGADVRVPWSGFDLINAFNRWKRSDAAGVHEDGSVGLAWRAEVTQQVFEEAAVDLGRGLAAFSARRTTGNRLAGFPKFKSRHDANQSFRIRNKARGNSSSIRIGAEGRERSIELPKLGSLLVRECTRRMRRMLKKGRLKILFATISHRVGGHWKVSINVEAAAFHPAQRHPDEGASAAIGIDRGLLTFAVLADAEGREVERLEAPRPLRKELPKLRRLSRSVSRKKKGSKNRSKAKVRLSRLHHRIGNVRRDFVHRVSSRLAKTHGHLILETLSTAGMMKTRLARSLADSAWAMFAQALQYKQAWRGGTLVFADRFYPSTRRCGACAVVGEALPLSERTFHCRHCGHEADRDTNAAVNLAQYPESSWSHVAAKQAETQNVCREESADAWAGPSRETVLVEAERAFAQRPRRAVSVG
jgi:putative transposase